MAGSLACLRYFLIGGAIVIGVCGAVQSVFAGYFIYQLHEYSHLTPDDVCGSPATLLAMGLITCIIGWCAWQLLDFTNRGQVIIFSLALITITVINTTGGIWALVKHEQVDTLPPAYVEQLFTLAVTDDKPFWDKMQSKLTCCGMNGPADYHRQDSIPWSCCNNTVPVDSSDNKGVCTSMYARGCQHVVINRTRSILLHVFLLALCTVLLQISFTICITCYVRAFRERVERRKELMIAAQSFAQASKDLETGDNLLNRQSRYSKASTNAQ